jgi:hypothetical protein
MARAVTIVLRDGGANGFAVVFQEPLERQQISSATGFIGHRGGQVRRTL